MSEGDWGYKLAQANETIRAANAEIAKLWKERNEAKAEIARLRELLEPFANAVTIHGKRISSELAALKPEGEKP